MKLVDGYAMQTYGSGMCGLIIVYGNSECRASHVICFQFVKWRRWKSTSELKKQTRRIRDGDLDVKSQRGMWITVK